MNVAIIGAGASGLCAAKRSLEAGLNVTVFEKHRNIGGTWVYTDQVGKDENGSEIHTSMYQGLRTNLPKEVMGFPDFPIDHQELSYISAEDFLKFLQQYCEKFKLKELIQFRHEVIMLKPRNKKWEMVVVNLTTNEHKTLTFDAVMICNGHYHTPALPIIPGSDCFRGRQIHSHDYRNSDAFKNSRILVIGAGPSGLDMARDLASVAKHVALSHRFPEDIASQLCSKLLLKPVVAEIKRTSVVFVDGSEDEFDTILYCTGYKYSFPFLSQASEILVEDNHVSPLYKHIINIFYPTMAFIGLPFYVCAMQMFDLQVRFFLKYLTGGKELPSQAEMMEDMRREVSERQTNGYKKKQFHMMGPIQLTYYEDLSKTAEIEGIKPVLAKLHTESGKRFKNNLFNFRDFKYRIVDDENFVETC